MPKKTKSPAFQFYPNDWLSSPRLAMMTAEQEGAYIRLLCYCWNDDDLSIPDDDKILASLARVDEGCLQLVKDCFIKHPKKENFLTQERLQKEKKKQDAWKKKSSEGGKKSAESRARAKKEGFKGGSRVVQPKPNSSSSISSSFTNNSWQGKTINLAEKDYDKYRKLASHLNDKDFEDCLTKADMYYSTDDKKGKEWRISLINWIKNENPSKGIDNPNSVKNLPQLEDWGM